MDKQIRPKSSVETVKKRYLFFGEKEVRGRCPIYEKLALQIAADLDLISLIATFPKNKRQPNLLLASLRKFFNRVPSFQEARALMLDNPEPLTDIIFSHSTQTNEPGRCATLLPLLCQLPQPLALLEIGTSAGLCLIPDLYNYRYGAELLTGAPAHPEFELACAAGAGVSIPKKLPEVVWRAGLDTNPLNIHDAEQRSWLEMLVWPSQKARLQRLQASITLAAKEDLHLETGDLHTLDLEEMISKAPQDATLVVFHSAVLSYTLETKQRDAFAERIRTLTDYWVSNELPLLFSSFGCDLINERTGSDFLLALNGKPFAWTDPHGASIIAVEHSTDV